MIRLRVRAPDGTRRPLLLGPGALEHLRRLWPREARAAALIADRNVMRLHGAPVLRLLRRCVPLVRAFAFPPGERSKTRATKADLEDRMLAEGLGRDTCVVALGGGVTLDLAGFVAATYLRGVPSLLLPTSLLAQLDASIGGKTGVDVPAGKNLVGAFHFPAAVLIDPRVLRTLPERERRCGLTEAVKHAVVGDPALFRLLERRAPHLRRPGPLDAALVGAAVRVKLAVVARDPLEHGPRAVLNFGHTVGHALEAASGGRVPHGLAVAVGMAVEADVAVTQCGFPAADRDRLRNLLARLGLPAGHPLPFARLAPFLAADKKNRRGALRLALPARLGRMAGSRDGWTVPVDSSALREAWDRRRTALRGRSP
jgi:3-dehydroquinate synthase